MEGTSVETTDGEIDGKFEGTAEVDGAFVLNDGLLVEDGALVETVVEGALLEVGDFVDEGRFVLIFCIGIYSLRSCRRRSFRLVVTLAIELDDTG